MSVFNTKDEFAKYVSDMKFNMKVDVFWKVKTGEWGGFVVTKIWIDSKTFNLIAYEGPSERKFCPSFANFLNTVSPVLPGDISPLDKIEDKFDLSVDKILDKISKFGIVSLTKEQKMFLDSQK